MDAGVGGIHQHHGGRGGPPPLPGQHPLEVLYQIYELTCNKKKFAFNLHIMLKLIFYSF